MILFLYCIENSTKGIWKFRFWKYPDQPIAAGLFFIVVILILILILMEF